MHERALIFCYDNLNMSQLHFLRSRHPLINATFIHKLHLPAKHASDFLSQFRNYLYTNRNMTTPCAIVFVMCHDEMVGKCLILVLELAGPDEMRAREIQISRQM